MYQTAGDALHLQDNSQNDTVKNNIFWATAGYDIFVATNSESRIRQRLQRSVCHRHRQGGQLAGGGYTTRANWFLSLGFDVHRFSR